MNALRQEAIDEVLDKLTPSQAATWKAMTGQPFTGTVNFFGNPFGRGFGKRGGRGDNH